jgi:hypothetical protein
MKAHLCRYCAIHFAEDGTGRPTYKIDHRQMKTDIATLNPRVPSYLFVWAEFRQTMGYPIRRYIGPGNAKHGTTGRYGLTTGRCDLIARIREY